MNETIDAFIERLAIKNKIHYGTLWQGNYKYRGTYGGEEVYVLYDKTYWFDRKKNDDYLDLKMITPRWANYNGKNKEIFK